MAQLEAEAHKLKEGMASCLQARQQGLAGQQQDLRKELAALQVRGPGLSKKADNGGTACVSLPQGKPAGLSQEPSCQAPETGAGKRPWARTHLEQVLHAQLEEWQAVAILTPGHVVPCSAGCLHSFLTGTAANFSWGAKVLKAPQLGQVEAPEQAVVVL